MTDTRVRYSPTFVDQTYAVGRRIAYLGVQILVMSVLLFSAAGCDSGDPEEEQRSTIDGTWLGLVDIGGTGYPFQLVVTASGTGGFGSEAVGNGSIDTPEGTLTFQASGSYLQNALELTLEFPSIRPATLSGTVSADRTQITGTVIGGPNLNSTFELTRQ